MEDYIDFVLGRNQPKKPGGEKAAKSGGGKSSGAKSAKARAQLRQVQAEIARVEKAMAKLQADCTELDRAMYEPANAAAPLADRPMGELLAERAQVSGELEQAEAEWLALSERLEAIQRG